MARASSARTPSARRATALAIAATLLLVHEGQRDIWIASVAGGPAEQFTTEPAADIHPAWSPDGTRLAFVSDRVGGVNQVFAAAVRNGRRVGAPQQITSGPRGCWSPRFSPDGASIAFVGSGDSSEVFIVPADGGGPATQITRGAFAQRLRWHPKRKTVFVSGGWGRAARLVLREVNPRELSVSELKPPVAFGDSETVFEHLVHQVAVEHRPRRRVFGRMNL